jgi:glycosyltransferase involved in cell wall biosynthesis
MSIAAPAACPPDRESNVPQTSPLVSVIIPCYRQAHFLSDAIESVLTQSYPNVEAIVINDGSPDDTADVAARYSSVRYVEQANRGLAAARNAGLAHSHGEFIVFLDADDRLMPDALRMNAALLGSNPAAGFVAGTSHYISREGTPIPTDSRAWPSGDIYAALLQRNRIRMPAMVMFRKNVFQRLGGFNTDVDACADYEMYLRVSRHFPVAFHDAPVAEYRRHGENMSLDPVLMLRQLCHVLRQERRHVRDTHSHRAALAEGQRAVRAYYGDLLSKRIRERVRTRTALRHASTDVFWLFVLHPRGFLAHVFRKSMTAARRSRSTDESDEHRTVGAELINGRRLR